MRMPPPQRPPPPSHPPGTASQAALLDEWGGRGMWPTGPSFQAAAGEDGADVPAHLRLTMGKLALAALLRAARGLGDAKRGELGRYGPGAQRLGAAARLSKRRRPRPPPTPLAARRRRPPKTPTKPPLLANPFPPHQASPASSSLPLRRRSCGAPGCRTPRCLPRCGPRSSW
jgi:hypothetical protein